MPKLWNETIETHRREVREAIMDAASTLVAKHGLLSVTMSQIAEETGIGRATLYKYFSEVEEILHAWHERQITEHFEYLAEVRDRATGAGEQLKAVLEAYALIAHGTHGHGESDLAEFLHHQGRQVARAEEKLSDLIEELIAKAAKAGQVRSDVAAEELTTYCLHALTGAHKLRSRAAVQRLVAVIMDGMQG
jgi:AcrR family transcriptional regulator